MTNLNATQLFYKNKTIFITGASGFMGKCLLEKLLYSCSEVKEIIILMRPKRGKSAKERVADFANLPVSLLIDLLIILTLHYTFIVHIFKRLLNVYSLSSFNINLNVNLVIIESIKSHLWCFNQGKAIDVKATRLHDI